MKLTVYRILSFLLIPVAVIFSICILILITAALANPSLLMPLFLIACVSIYSFASLRFLITGIDGKKYLGKTSREFLRVNAFVSIVFALLMISQCIVLIIHPELIEQLARQTKQNAIAGLKLDANAMGNYMRITSYFFLIYALVLAVHILLSFQYMKQYNYLFRNDSSN